MNFVDYVNQFRLRKAKELLENTSYNISQIAELVGYSSANSFSKVFKNIMAYLRRSIEKFNIRKSMEDPFLMSGEKGLLHYLKSFYFVRHEIKRIAM